MKNLLFSSDKDWTTNACLNSSFDSMGLYIEGYKEAADTLVNDIIKHRTNQDILVFPISFLYRQYIELQLKQIIKESRILLDGDASFPTHHKINNLWNTAHALMIKIIEDHDQDVKTYITNEDIKEINTIITEFVKVDPESFSFRYPNDKKGKNTLEGITHINLGKLQEKMKSLKEKLDKYYLVVSILGDFQDEMRAQHGP